jgi:hypothetical protein
MKGKYSLTLEDFKRADLRWQQIEVDMEMLQKRQAEYSRAIEQMPLHLATGLYAAFDILTEEIRMITLEQQEIEEFLIENEAPGWTST